MFDVDSDLIIIGGGVAGLTAAQYGARSALRTLLIESAAPGGQALVIDGLENYPGFDEPIPGFELAMKFQKQAQDFGVEFLYTSVISVKKENDIFSIETGEGTKTALAIIIATGAKHRHLGIPGEERLSGRGVSYCATCDGPFFRDKKILVVGGGDSACDEALFLSKLSDKITLIHRKDRFRAQKVIADRILNHPNIEVRFNTLPLEILGDDKVMSVVLKKTDGSEETYTEDFSAIFIFVGTLPQNQLVNEMVELDEGGYINTDSHLQTSTNGLFAAGDVRVTPFRQVVTAASDGAIAAHCANEYIDCLKGNGYK